MSREAATHVPRPREHELPGGDLAVSSHWVHGVSDATVVPAQDRPLYRLLMDLLEDVWCPDCLPARLATECDDLVDAKRAVENIDRGRADIGNRGYGMGYCYRVRDAIEEYRDREPITLVAVGCSGSKYEVDELVPAEELYRGGYWTNKRDYYQVVGDDGRIVSAEHGLLHPSEPIEYYETHIEDLDGIPVDHDGRLPSGEEIRTLVDLWAFEVHNGLAQWIDDVAGGIDPRDVELQVLLGKPYHQRLRERDVFDGLRARGDIDISFPFRDEVDYSNGGGIGNQRSWLTDEIEAARAVATDGGTPEGSR